MAMDVSLWETDGASDKLLGETISEYCATLSPATHHPPCTVPLANITMLQGEWWPLLTYSPLRPSLSQHDFKSE